MKPVDFCGNALDALRAFPDNARREAGYQIDKVQNGQDPNDWKPMASIGAGVKEIRIRDEAGSFRVIYLAKLADAYLCCTVSKRKPSRPARKTSGLPETDSRN